MPWTPRTDDMALIEVRDLGVQFQTGDGLVYAVNGRCGAYI